MIINLTFKLHFFFIYLSTIMSLAPGDCRIILFIWLLLFDWWPGIGIGGGTRNIEFGTKGCESGTTDCELGCESDYDSFQSSKDPKMATFFRFLPVLIFFELCLRRCSVFPLFSVAIKQGGQVYND